MIADSTHRKEAEKQLKVSEVSYRTLTQCLESLQFRPQREITEDLERQLFSGLEEEVDRSLTKDQLRSIIDKADDKGHLAQLLDQEV